MNERLRGVFFGAGMGGSFRGNGVEGAGRGWCGAMEVDRADWRSRGVVMEVGVVKGTARECMGDALARGGWICTTGEHVSLIGCSCERCVHYIHQN